MLNRFPFFQQYFILIVLFFSTINILAFEGGDSLKLAPIYPSSYFENASPTGSSTAKVFSTNKGTNIKFTNPYNNQQMETFAGTFNGEVDANSAQFYCIDISKIIGFYTQNQPHTYTDNGFTSAEITYILNNYYPNKPYPYSNAASTIEKEAAAIQAAIWHFSDGVNVNTITASNQSVGTEIKNRAIQIVNDAINNSGSTVPTITLIIVPDNQSVQTGNSAYFFVAATDMNGNPIPNLQITLTSTSGTLNESTTMTDNNGVTPQLFLMQGSNNYALITAIANTPIPQGTKYVHTVQPNNYQKLVLATPTFAQNSATSEVTWYSSTGDCNLNGFVTYTQGGWGSPSSSVPGQIRNQYFSSVFPNGLTIGGNYTITLTSANAVKDFLPQGGTPSALTHNYTNPSSTSSGVLGGQVAALALNVAFDQAGYIGTNSFNLGDLVIVSGPFNGMTVNQFLALANSALGGGNVNYTFSQINEAATAINENFDNGSVDKGFLSCPINYSSIGDKVWNDANQNGIQDNGELGISGVTVELYNCNNNLISSTTTDNNGNYLFSNLNPGDYYIKVVLPAGYFFSPQDQSSNDAIDSDVDTQNGRSICTTLSPGENDLTWDAGMYQPKSSIGDKVWNDTNKNGIQENGEIGVSGVEVKLYDCGNNFISSTVTDNNGNYLFDNLTPGDYYVKFILPDDYHFTLKDSGNDDSIDSDADVMTGTTTCTTLSANENDLSWDAGIYYEAPQVESDLSLTKSVDNPTPNNGDNITFTLTLTNNGPADASGIKVMDVLPNGLDFVSASSNVGSYDSNTGIWNVGNLTNGSTATLNITVNVNVQNTSNNLVDLGIASSFNVFVLQDLTQPSSDTQGRLAVGRDASLANYSVGDQLPNSNGTLDVLIVGRNLTFTSGAVYAGNVVYGNSTNLPIYPVSIEGSLRQDYPIDFNSAQAYLNNLSHQLSTHTSNGTVTYQWGGLFLNGTDPFLNVFYVSGSVLSNANNFVIDVPNGAVVVVNIDGQNVNWKGGLSVVGTSINNVLFNFYEANLIEIKNIDIRGTILAPSAKVNFISGVQNGQMIAYALEGAGQFNNAHFIGNVPGQTILVNIAEIINMDQHDPDSTPNNGVMTEDDYASATITINPVNQPVNDPNSWQIVNNFSDPNAVLTITADQNGNLFSATSGGNVYRSVDNGGNWESVNISSKYVWSITNYDNLLFAATNNGVYVSSNNGNTWELKGLENNDVRTIVFDNTGNLYAATWNNGILKSNDKGNSWIEMSDGLGNAQITSLAINSKSELFAGTFGNGLLKFNTNDTKWTKVNINNQTGEVNYVWSLGINADDEVYVGTYGNGVFTSKDNGNTFTAMNDGLNGKYIYSISFDANKNVYVNSSESGVFSMNYGENKWNSFGMNGLGVTSIAVNSNAKSILAGTKEGQIYTKPVNITDVNDNNEIPTEFRLEQNYPNPFNPTTTIEFSVVNKEHISLVIYNILGQEVRTLINNELNPGNYKVTFDGKGLASGVYIYRLSSNSATFVKKMILQK